MKQQHNSVRARNENNKRLVICFQIIGCRKNTFSNGSRHRDGLHTILWKKVYFLQMRGVTSLRLPETISCMHSMTVIYTTVHRLRWDDVSKLKF